MKTHANCEVFTASTGREDLLDTEAVLIQSLENYIRAENVLKETQLSVRLFFISGSFSSLTAEEIYIYTNEPLQNNRLNQYRGSKLWKDLTHIK